LYKLVD